MTNATPWVTRAGWLAALPGALLAVLLLGGQTPKVAERNQQSSEFAALTIEDQRAVRVSASDFFGQSAERQQELRQIAAAVEDDAELERLTRCFSNWRTKLTPEDRDVFRSADREEQLRMARDGIRSENRQNPGIVVEFPGSPEARLPRLHMTFDEFDAVVNDALDETRRPVELREELDSLSRPEWRTLRLGLWIFETMSSRGAGDLLGQNQENLRKALLENISDSDWKRAYLRLQGGFSGRRFESFWTTMTMARIVDQSVTDLGESLLEKFPVSEQQILDAFAAVDDEDLRQQLMTLPADDSRTRLMHLAQSKAGTTPESKLVSRYTQYVETRGRLLRMMPYGFGQPPGPEGPPGRGDGDRRGPPGLPPVP